MPDDIDLATLAALNEMTEMFTAENISFAGNEAFYGTFTVRINDEENFDVTRHVEDEITVTWLLDASRRDLTINSMFLGFDGKVYDYFYGYEDLMNRRVRFVGEAAIRIPENHIRILRYFR